MLATVLAILLLTSMGFRRTQVPSGTRTTGFVSAGTMAQRSQNLFLKIQTSRIVRFRNHQISITVTGATSVTQKRIARRANCVLPETEMSTIPTIETNSTKHGFYLVRYPYLRWGMRSSCVWVQSTGLKKESLLQTTNSSLLDTNCDNGND